MKRWIVLWIAVMAMLLTGCAGSPRNEDTDAAVSPEETVGQTTVSEAGETADADDRQYNDICAVLWGYLLQRMDGLAPISDGKTEWEWNREYEAEVLLQDFAVGNSRYSAILIYPPDDMNGISLRWESGVSDAEIYAAEYPEFNFSGSNSYEEGDEAIAEARGQSALRITGKVKSETYEQGNQFTDHLYPYFYYLMWGSVLREAGNLYRESSGGIWGQFTGSAYMMKFDFETLTGYYVICLEGEEPVQVELTFANQDCRTYTMRKTYPEQFGEEERKDAWMGLTFDLTTAKPNQS